jgi:uncharacterized membrane protein YbhN (UPF0104 family)
VLKVTDQLFPGITGKLPGTVPPTFKLKKVLRRWLPRLLGTGVLLVLIWRLNLNWGRVFADVVRVNFWAVMVAVSLIFPIIGLKAWRWRYLLTNYKIMLSLPQAVALYGQGVSLGSITPGQAGDVIKAFYLQKQGYALGRSIGSVLLDRLFDVLILVFVALLGMFQLGKNYTGQLPTMLGLLALVGGGIITLVVPRFSVFFLEQLPARLVRRKIQGGKAWAGITSEDDGVGPGYSLSGASISGAIVLTLLTAGLAIGRTWLLALAIGINLGPSAALAVSSLATVASLVPVTISGIGARDLTLISIMSQLGYSNELAVTLSTLLLLLNLLNFFAGYAVWIIFSQYEKRRNSCVAKNLVIEKSHDRLVK